MGSGPTVRMDWFTLNEGLAARSNVLSPASSVADVVDALNATSVKAGWSMKDALA